MKTKSFLAQLYEILKPFRRTIATIAMFLFVEQLFQLASPYIIGRVINAYSGKAPISMVEGFALLGLLVFTAKSFTTGIRERYELKRFENSVPLHLATITIGKLFGWSIAQHRRQHSGLVQSIVVEGEQGLTNAAHLITYEVFQLVSQMMLTLGLIFWINRSFGLIVMVVGASFAFITYKLSMYIREDLLEYEKKRHRVSKAYVEIERNVSFIITQAQEERESEACFKGHSDLREFGDNVWSWYDTRASWRNLLIGLGDAVVIILGAYMIDYHAYTPGLMVTCLLWAHALFDKMYSIGPIVRKSYRLWPGVVAYFDLLNTQPELVQDPHPVRPKVIHGEIAARHMTFWHDRVNNAEPTLVDINFTIRPGEKIGIVGASGAGKSTLISLLLRVTDPNEGGIFIDGIDLRRYDIKQYRRAIGFVEQHVPVLDRTLRENILFGLENPESVSHARLEEVVRACRVDEFLSELPDGFDTMLGEQGVRLSGGQCQRVGIARALVKNPAILIFDEATSHLDSENEHWIHEAIKAASIGRTTIIIAHRNATVRDCDRILVVKDGRIVGQDGHDQLMDNCPDYSTLVGRQLLN